MLVRITTTTTYNFRTIMHLHTHTGLLCPASCSDRLGDAEALQQPTYYSLHTHATPCHLASRITLLRLARRPISPIRHPRRPPCLASLATTHATARSTCGTLCKAWALPTALATRALYVRVGGTVPRHLSTASLVSPPMLETAVSPTQTCHSKR